MNDIDRAHELAGCAIRALTHRDLANKPEIISVHIDPGYVLIDIEGDADDADDALLELARRPTSQEEFKGAALTLYGKTDPSADMRVEVRAYRTKGRGQNLRNWLRDRIEAHA